MTAPGPLSDSLSDSDTGSDSGADSASGGVTSLDRALQLLGLLAGHPGPAALSDLAREAGMPPSKAHRYLASFVRAGMVRQTAKSGKYDLGPESLRLGLAAMARINLVNESADRLPDLVAETGLTALLCVWGSYGPTVVRWERAAGFIVTALGLGSTLPLVGSATGRIFLAYAPPELTDQVLAPEDAELAGALRSRTRARGLASVSGDLIHNLSAVAAPVLDWQGQVQASVTLIGTDAAIANLDGAAAAALDRFCRELSVFG